MVLRWRFVSMKFLHLKTDGYPWMARVFGLQIEFFCHLMEFMIKSFQHVICAMVMHTCAFNEMQTGRKPK